MEQNFEDWRLFVKNFRTLTLIGCTLCTSLCIFLTIGSGANSSSWFKVGQRCAVKLNSNKREFFVKLFLLPVLQGHSSFVF